MKSVGKKATKMTGNKKIILWLLYKKNMYILLSSLLFNYFIFMEKTLLLLLFIKFIFFINIKIILIS